MCPRVRRGGQPAPARRATRRRHPVQHGAAARPQQAVPYYPSHWDMEFKLILDRCMKP